MGMRDGNALVARVLSRQGRYRGVGDNLRVKEVRLEGTDQRLVICHNPEQAERDKLGRQQAVTRIEAELARITAQRQRDRKRQLAGKAAHKANAAPVKAECELRDHPTLGRWIRQLASGRLVIDRAKVKAEQRLDGMYLLATSDPDISAEDVALGTRTCWRPSAASVTGRPPCCCGRSSIGWCGASARTC